MDYSPSIIHLLWVVSGDITWYGEGLEAATTLGSFVHEQAEEVMVVWG